ncbi:HEPN domain-containing protein [Streptomyces odonnellii]|uniref:HEPN domain-containing protein n=1 Tax=Streptomyces odonnellii TaxID=1417980 RepID=UPI000B2A323A|nr:HEPN domain-containing protein [Streptomyces odonnellii]
MRDRQLARPGMVVFPVHSFGLLAGGLLRFRSARSWIFSPPGSRIALFPQTNRWSKTRENLDEVRRAFGVRKELPLERLEHWRRSRPVAWLEQNPIMAISVSTAPGSYYDTEHLVLGRLRASSALACLLAAVQPHNDMPGGFLFSSARTNNWETLDIHHYLSLFDSPADRRALDGNCVPIGLRKAALAEISELNIEIDPSYWARRRSFADVARDAVDQVYDGYMRHARLRRPTTRPDALSKAFTKLHDSLAYFRRSFHASDQSWSQIVSLAVAFEMMLTDGSNAGAIAAKLQRRVRLLLRGQPGVRGYSEAVHDLYKHRNGVVHAGTVATGVDLAQARRGFALCFVELARRSVSLTPTMEEPMRDLIGDSYVSPSKPCSHRSP